MQGYVLHNFPTVPHGINLFQFCVADGNFLIIDIEGHSNINKGGRRSNASSSSFSSPHA